MGPKETPSQTAGPYVHIGCTPNFSGISNVYAEDLGHRMITGDVGGERITVTGTVYDGAGQALKDALIEIWQADANGLFHAPGETRGTPDPNFFGWGRAASDMETGAYRFETVKPGRVPAADGALQAPHISVWIVARGINVGLQTRLYFEDEAEANAEDPLLARIEHRARVGTLLAKVEGVGRYRFDIHLQGPDETVFLDI
ncbi:protocatechuate 3,4-dioxygenase subunit alpha [Sulfitobacter sp. D35]|uniref:protocatechuate 3,4-dioxygenase subunit alpha n=1 Tax=Sulfitobacter sp. D35 TaxID=3083252 RepID=UPI00296F8D67|nr:protocatechuate 3,4-dioxygenase subunit alpha [Sulfitobacter sp. D35]MDW4496432.1 protocatechuate 3,4-dioxygenase subunit alpha [Sulfitobacter sp. D35]